MIEILNINWTNDKIKKTQLLIEKWLFSNDCYSSEHACQCDDCIIDAVNLVGDLADLLVDDHEFEEDI